MKLPLIAVLLLIYVSSFAQSVNDYQYVIVPEKFDFAKSIDEYQLNSLTQFLFNKYGFDSYRERDEKPPGLKNGSCDALYADVESDSNFRISRFTVFLKDCNGKVIFVSEQGRSKEKDYKKSYHEALRDAFISIQELQYSYNGTSQEKKKEEETTPSNEASKEQSETKTKKPITPRPVVDDQTITEVKEEVEKITSTDGTYQSADGFYKLVVKEDNLTIFEGTQKIGTAITNDTKTYEVLTTQFTGKGYFENNTFIVDRTVKGIGVVKMIFSKSK